MRFYKFFAFLLALGLVFQTAVAAQPASAENNDDPLPPESKRRALELLTSAASDAQLLRVPENRVRVQITIGGLLWKHDEAQARQAFENAYAELQSLLANVSVPEDLESSTSVIAKHYALRHRLAELRGEYVLALAAHDSQGALDALSGLKIQLLDEYDPLRPNELELQITEAIVRENPDRSYAVAKRLLDADGITHQFIEAVKNLHKKDSRLAATLGRDILAKIKSSKIRVPSARTGKPNEKARNEVDFWEVATFITSAAQINRLATLEKSKKIAPLLAESEMKELVELIAGAFLTDPNPAQYSITQIMPEITRLAPAQAQRIRQKIGAEAARTLDKDVETNSFFFQTQEKTPDELARMAGVSAPEVRDYRYAFAALKALAENDPEKAQRISANIKERKGYVYLFEQINATLPLAKARRGDLPEVRKILATLKTDRERIATLTELASALAAKGEKEAARALLDESRQMMSAILKNYTDLESIIKVSAVYAVASPEQAFAILEGGIGRVNEYIDAGLRLDEFYEGGATEADELRFTSISRQMLTHVPKSSELLRNLALADFDRALRLADDFQRPEIRLFVRLRIAEALLDDKASEKEHARREQVAGDDDEMQ